MTNFDPIYSGVWIGLLSINNDWEWISGEPVTYQAPIQGMRYWDGEHMYLHTFSHPVHSPGSWNYNGIHDTDPYYYLFGVIEIPEPTSAALMTLAGLFIALKRKQR